MIDVVNEQLHDFGQLYRRYQVEEPIAQQLLQVQHSYLINLEFDPLTGKALPQRMSHWLSQDIRAPEKTQLHDRFTYLIDHCADAVNSILIMPRQTVIRVHEMTPVYLAQRLDSRSVRWLSRKPGNNLREKLAANPHILAATRKMSFDTLENRLLKAFLIRVKGLLLDRQEAGLKLNEQQESLVDSIQKTLGQEEFVAIKPWQHMPPNNVLLQDKEYRKVWRAWQLLNRLEEDCEHQQKNGVASGFAIFGELLKQMTVIERCLLLDQAWQFKIDYLSANFMIDKKEELVPFEVIVVDLGDNLESDEVQITPKATLFLSLSVDGNIHIQQHALSGEIREWHLNFQQTDGLIEVKLSSSSKSDTQDGVWYRAMPKEFSRLAKWLVSELLPGDKSLRQQLEPVTKTSDDFVTLMFDGASCKLETNTKAVHRIGPHLLDTAGLNCSHSLSVSVDEKIFSTKELSQVTGDSHTGCLSGFVDLLASHVQPTQGMHYLVSDHHSEFETSDLRREMNRNFSNASPLPKSIAAVYAILEKKPFDRNDLIMVLSSDNYGIYVTPIYYCWGKKPGEEYFERHPSIKLSDQGEQLLLQEALVKTGLPDSVAKKFIELYSYSELMSSKDKLTLYDGEYCYQIPTNLKVANIDVSDLLFKEVYALPKKQEKTYFLSVSSIVKQQKGIRPTQWLASDPLSGSQSLLKRQHAEPQKVFWKDHLPQLMTRLPINGIEKNFNFVDSQTSVKPERGVAAPIFIADCFTLPNGQDEICFTVYQGTDSNRQEFSLLLSLRQPLKTACECELKLTYTYGDEQPYKLRFEPKNKNNKPFNYIEARWGKKQDSIANRVVAIPVFPERLAFDKLREYQGYKGSTDIIEKLELNFNKLAELHERVNNRFDFDYQEIQWHSSNNFGFYKSHPSYSSLYINRHGFRDVELSEESVFSASVQVLERGNSMENIGKKGHLLSSFEAKNLHKWWRFPMLIFSDQARSFDDEEIPKKFAQKGKQAIEQAQELLTLLQDSNKILARELIQFLCYTHKLIPQSTVDNLLQMATEKYLLRKESNWFKYALGDVSQSWQKQLLLQILEPVDDTGGTRAATLEILSVAMWRDKAIIDQLTADQVTALAKRLNEHLLDEIKWLKKEDKFFKWNSFILRLELLLALLRTRESPYPAISSLFALDSHLTKQLLGTVEKITDQQGELLAYQLQQPRVVARVKLALDKPDGYYRTPDLLYALKLYLSGDNGADKIKITELVNSA